MFSKIRVTGKDMHPLYRFLTEKRTNPRFAGAITWNFNKFLIGREGAIRARFRTQDEPQSAALRAAVEAALGS
jgi:glutathione peroxidase